MYYKVNVYFPDNTKSVAVAANLTISGDTVTFTKIGKINMLDIYNETAPYKVTVKGLPVYAYELSQDELQKIKEHEDRRFKKT